jgi:hypothetical protein
MFFNVILPFNDTLAARDGVFLDVDKGRVFLLQHKDYPLAMYEKLLMLN